MIRYALAKLLARGPHIRRGIPTLAMSWHLNRRRWLGTSSLRAAAITRRPTRRTGASASYYVDEDLVYARAQFSYANIAEAPDKGEQKDPIFRPGPQQGLVADVDSGDHAG